MSWECDHDYTFVKKKTSGGFYQLRLQCSKCTHIQPQSHKHDNVDDINKVPDAVEDISWKEKYNREKAGRDQRREEEERRKKERYEKYLQSNRWAAKRALVMKRDNHTCQSCLSAPATEVHHKTYARIYNEPLFDLVAICRRCHQSVHTYDPADYKSEDELFFALFNNLITHKWL